MLDAAGLGDQPLERADARAHRQHPVGEHRLNGGELGVAEVGPA